MGKKERYDIHPQGYTEDPQEERFPLSTLDYLSACAYNNYALFFHIADSEKTETARVVREGLQLTLAQCRHLVGWIETNSDNSGHCFIKKRDTTVRFDVHWLDSPTDNFPSIDDLKKGDYASPQGYVSQLVIEEMTYGEKPENHPDSKPSTSGFQLNFIPGGAILVSHIHHYSNDIKGWLGFIEQLADNCRSLWTAAPVPKWDIACLDRTRFNGKHVPALNRIHGPNPPGRNELLKPFSSLLFHLPKSKASRLKELATPGHGSWISTYDAFSAYLWRVLSKHRARLYCSDLDEKPIWGQAIDMRPRLSPAVPARMQGNVMFAALSTNCGQGFTIREIISDASLSHLAIYIRNMSAGVTQAALAQTLDMLEAIRDKTSLFTRIDSFAPLTVITTDWRDIRVSKADFGFAVPDTFRHLLSGPVTGGLIIVYPPRSDDPQSDEGFEFMITYEQEIVKDLINDPDMESFFEFRGFEFENEEGPP